ncbi:membrane protein insertion efficiency factor YidD [bacterium AH-315-P13]|nr:membrane protein insertion efficiency factor YidD [bacterium AH-315-P13]
MKHFLIILIKIYQAFFPKKFRGRCLFKESCSNYVLRQTSDNGFYKGIYALLFRYKNCRPNYIISCNGKKILLITSDYEVFEEHEIDERII